jgi:hypothetical protein
MLTIPPHLSHLIFRRGGSSESSGNVEAAHLKEPVFQKRRLGDAQGFRCAASAILR